MPHYRVNTKNHFLGCMPATSAHEAAQRYSDKKLKTEPSETHWTKENAFASLTSDAFLVNDVTDKHAKWLIFYPQLRAVKVSLSDGDHFTTEMAHSLTDAQILDYYKIGQKINMGKGENDYFTTISNVQILQ